MRVYRRPFLNSAFDLQQMLSAQASCPLQLATVDDLPAETIHGVIQGMLRLTVT